MGDRTVKWSCSQCTYENGPWAQRCAICHSTRPSYPSPEHEIHSQNFDLTSSKLASGGWSCPACTYINWAASGRCTQCGTKSPISFSGPSVVLQQSTEPSLPSSGKWSCPTCTYENWPKSKRCVMCRSSPQQTVNAFTEPTSMDWSTVCKGIVVGDPEVLQQFLLSPETHRQIISQTLTSEECKALELIADASAHVRIRPGFNLLDLARSFSRADWVTHLSTMFPELDKSNEIPKRAVCQTSAAASKELRRFLDECIKQRKNHNLPCKYFSEFGTFYLPAGIRELPMASYEAMMQHICDTEVQNELEVTSKAINWWIVEGKDNQPTSRLVALWNRTDGDCLLDSVMQACWGVFDQQSSLRHALFESLTTCEQQFYQVWSSHEVQQVAGQYRPDEEQLLRDWRSALSAASQTRSPLEQIHVFVLAHILRRPIIVYSVKYIRNYRDEPIGLANFQGVYLPLLWEASFCSRDPVVLGYTRGHFAALVPSEPGPCDRLDVSTLLGLSAASPGSSATEAPANPSAPPTPPSSSSGSRISDDGSAHDDSQSPSEKYIYLPLFDHHGNQMPVPFAPKTAGSPGESELLRKRLVTVSSRKGHLIARLRLPLTQHPLFDDLMRDWLLFYRRMSPANASAGSGSASDV